MGALTEQQIEQIRQDGYIRAGSVLNAAQLDQIRDFLATMPVRPEDKGTLFYTQSRGKSAVLAELAARGPHLPLLRQIIGENLRCWYDQFVVKPPCEASGVFPWHQDNGYERPNPDNNVTVWIALDDVHEKNGCVWVVPGSHHQGLIPHQQKSETSWHIEVEVPGEGVPVLLKAGEAVIFTGYTLHRSLGNQTERPRRALFLEYCAADATCVDGTPINQRPTDCICRRRRPGREWR